MASKLQTNVTISAGSNRMVVWDGVAVRDVDVTVGEYETWDAFASEAEARLTAVCAGAWTVDVTAAGRPLIAVAPPAAFELRANHVDWSLPIGILGLTAAVHTALPLGGVVTAPYVHRHGWYPQTVPMRDITHRIVDVSVTYRSDRRRSSAVWSGDAGIPVIDLLYDLIPPALARIDAAADAERNVGTGLTVGDPWCAIERFALDLSLEPARCWYYWPDTTALTRHGPYAYPPESPLWSDPLALSSIRQPAGELWEIGLAGVGHVP